MDQANPYSIHEQERLNCTKQAMQGEVDAAEEQLQQTTEAESAPEKDPAKFSGKKSKAVAKEGTAKTQYGILRDNGIPEQDIPLFR